MYWYLLNSLPTPINIEGISSSNCLSLSMYLSWRPDIREPLLSLTAIFLPNLSSFNVEANSLIKTGNIKRDLFLSIYLPLISLLSIR